jgi:hypothetical protein
VVRRLADQVGLDRQRPFLICGQEVEAVGDLRGPAAGFDVAAGSEEGESRNAGGADACGPEQRTPLER